MSAFTPRFLECRDLGHAWERDGDVVRMFDGQVRSFTRVVKCSRCETTRKDEYRVSEAVVTPRKNRYQYPSGYRVKGGMSKGEARMLLFYPRVVRPEERREVS